MRLWLDCEWNDWQGELISMALVAEDETVWYYSLGCDNPSPWVAANVMPWLTNVPRITRNQMRELLGRFLALYPNGVHIIADWPEDISHFCNLLVMPGGLRIATPPLTMEVRRDIGSDLSKRPHEALADAFALKDAHLQLEARPITNSARLDEEGKR